MASAPPPIKADRNPAQAKAAGTPPATVPRLEPTLPEGLRLGAFEIKGVIAHSRAAVVYRVSDHSLGIPAAIKEYMPLGVARRSGNYQVEPIEAWHEDTIDLGRRAFFAESRALARCDDAALLRVTQLWEINGTAYRVMPLYSGKRLVDLRREMKAPIDETALRALLDRLLGALGAYHASAGVHGNVTPMNILMPALDRPVLFGPGKATVLLAAELGEPGRTDFEAAFAAPEQHESTDAAVIGASADLFGLAQTLRYCITGSAPIGHESLRASIHRLLGADAVSRYSDALLDALSSATATVPAERPQTLDEFRHRLRRLEAHGAALTASAAPAATVAPAAPAETVAPAPVPTPLAAPAYSEPLVAVPEAEPPADEESSETIDVSSVLGDLLQEPAEPPGTNEATRPGAIAPASTPDNAKPPHGGKRVEPTLNFAFDSAITRTHEAPERATHAEQPSHVHVDAAQTQPPHPQEPQRPEPIEAPRSGYEPGYAAGFEAAAMDREADHAAAYRAEMFDSADSPQTGASFRPKRSLLASPVLRMSAVVIGIGTLAILLILAVSGVWDPRGPALNLPPTSSGADAALTRPEPPGAEPATPATPEPATPPASALATPNTAPNTAPPPVVAAPRVEAPRAEVAAPNAAPAPAPAPTPAPTASAPAVTATTPPPSSTRESSSSKRRSAAPTETSSDPREACAGRTQFALYRCMQAQCGRTRWAAHPECVRLRKSDRVDPP